MLRARHKLLFPGLLGSARGYLLNENLLLASQYEPGGWLYENHSRDTGATVVDENGNVVWAKENLLGNPSLVESGGSIPEWVLTSGVTAETSGEVGPDGFPLVSMTIVGSNQRAYQSIADLVVGQSYLIEADFKKVSDGLRVLFRDATTGDQSRDLDLDTGDFGTGSEGGQFSDTAIEDMGGGVYRLSAVFTPASTSSSMWFHRILGEGVYLAGACSVRRLPSAGRLIVGDSGAGPFFAPRLQHDSSGNPLGYLHEPQATNIATESVDFSGYTSSVGSSGYQGTGSEGAMTPDYGTAPDGTDTATRVQLDLNGGSDAALGTNRSGIAVSIGSGITASSDHASSLYIKPLNGENLEDFVGYIGLIAGGAVDTPTDIEDVGDGWYRVFYASTPTGTTGTIRLQLVSSPGSTFDSLDCLIWGMQVEEGSAPTSIIPTYGLPATRQADSAEIDVPADSDGFAYVTYGDGGETTFAVTPGGTWTIPTDLDDTYSRIIFKR